MPAQRAKPKARKLPKEVKEAVAELPELHAAVSLTPVQLLGVMMRVVLEERITSDEIDQICTAYYNAMKEASRFD
jgi:hypothetical protein